MLKGLKQLGRREERLEEEHIQWYSWIQERTSVQGSPSLRSVLRLSLGQLLCRTNSWASALGRAFLGIFPAFSLTSGFYCPFKQRLNSPQIPVFIFFLSLCNPHCGPAELLSRATCPRFPIHFQPGRSRVRKVFQSVTHHMSAFFGPLHWILTLG